MCCFTQELPRWLFPEHITVFVDGRGEKVGWVGLAISKLWSASAHSSYTQIQSPAKGKLISYLEGLNGCLNFKGIRLDIPLKRGNVDGLANRSSHCKSLNDEFL